MISENIDKIKTLSILVTGYLFLSCCILFSHIYFTKDKYGWIYNSTVIVNNEITYQIVYIKDQFVFLSIMFLFTVFSFIILVLSRIIERELKIE